MKFCKDCTHFKLPAPGLNVGDYAKCAYGRVLNPVTGDHDLKTQSSEYCVTLRLSRIPGDCGSDARFFASVGESFVPFIAPVYAS